MHFRYFGMQITYEKLPFIDIQKPQPAAGHHHLGCDVSSPSRLRAVLRVRTPLRVSLKWQ